MNTFQTIRTIRTIRRRFIEAYRTQDFQSDYQYGPVKDRRVPPPVACESETATHCLQAAAQRLEFVVIGFLKGKSAIAVARLGGPEQNFTGEHLWARGYAVSTVGFELEQIGRYIREQEEAMDQEDDSKLNPRRASARRLNHLGDRP